MTDCRKPEDAAPLRRLLPVRALPRRRASVAMHLSVAPPAPAAIREAPVIAPATRAARSPTPAGWPARASA